jgi:hypothetical protein
MANPISIEEVLHYLQPTENILEIKKKLALPNEIALDIWNKNRSHILQSVRQSLRQGKKVCHFVDLIPKYGLRLTVFKSVVDALMILFNQEFAPSGAKVTYTYNSFCVDFSSLAPDEYEQNSTLLISILVTGIVVIGVYLLI